MPLEITLLGPPAARRDGTPVDGIRGRKAWSLLAYLLLAGAPVSRDRLARVLFPDAGDPGGVVRWNLSQLRRHLGVQIEGDPVTLTLPPGAEVDVWQLHRHDTTSAVTLPGLGEELLTGTSAGESAAFEAWLEGERRHLRALSADVLRQAALERAARGQAEAAAALAERVVALEPLDENAAVLLVRTLRAAGRTEEARQAATAATERLSRQLGEPPGAALRAAAHAPIIRHGPAGSGRRAVETELDAGLAALSAGATDAGLDLLREALGGARALGGATLLARALTELGRALIHAVRGVDQDAIALLHEAISLHEAAEVDASPATALRELGYVEVLRGRYPRAAGWFERASRAAGGDLAEHAWIATFAGMARTDEADYPSAAALLARAVEHADAADEPAARAMARSTRGRLRLLTGDLVGAAADLDEAIAITADRGLRAMQPWPATLRADVDLAGGELAVADDRLERAYATARQVGDPCWESMALRGLGLLRVRRGSVDEGVELLGAAPTACRRLPDTYLWIEAYGLDALAAVGVEHGLEPSGRWARGLDDLATAHGMRELSLRAARHRAALGEAGADDLVATRSDRLAAAAPGADTHVAAASGATPGSVASN